MFISFSYGQDTLVNKEKNLIIKFSPILFVGGDFITISIGLPLGFEYKINKNFSFDQNFSYIIRGIDIQTSPTIHTHTKHDVEKIKGIRTDSELKHYLNKKNNSTGFYLATHLMYQYTDAIVEYQYFDGNQFPIVLKNYYASVYRNLFALHEKTGWQFVSKKGFVFDIAIGFGVRYVYSKASNTKDSGLFNEYTLYYLYQKPYGYGSKWFFSVNGSFKIGWMINFNKKNKV